MKKIRWLLFVILLFSACGIDNIVYLDKPVLIHDPSELGDDSRLYFEFRTSDKNNTRDASGYFKGFDIFYRIYENKNSCATDISSAKTYNDSNPSNSANYLRNTLSFKFLTRVGKSVSSRPFIDGASYDRNIRFRLSSYASDTDSITIDGVNLGTVMRETSQTFRQINKKDIDVKSDSSASTNNYLYVAVFAAAYGTDNSFKPAYSEILFLGYVRINKPSDF